MSEAVDLFHGAVVPADVDAERYVIGSMLLTGSVVDEVIETGLRGEHFYQPRAEILYDAIVANAASGMPCTPVAIADAMTKAGTLMQAGGHVALHEAVQAVSTPANAAFYADIVRERYFMRALSKAGAQIQHMSTGHGDGDVVEIASHAQKMIAEIVDDMAGMRTGSGNGIDEALASLQAQPYVKTPWRELNDAIGGWTPTWHYVIGARPSVGKTVKAGNIALDAARRGWRVLIFSMEMPRGELMLRMLADAASVHLSKLLHRSHNMEDQAALESAAADMRRLPITIDDRSHLSQSLMRAKIKAEQRHGQPVLVIVDYLQLTKPPNGREERRVQVDAIAQGYKDMARDLTVPVISLAQLSRAAEGRATPMPTLTDLREAGGIEASADVVILMHRQTNPEMGDVTDLRNFIAKNRHGTTSVYGLRFIGEYARIDDLPIVRSDGWGSPR